VTPEYVLSPPGIDSILSFMVICRLQPRNLLLRLSRRALASDPVAGAAACYQGEAQNEQYHHDRHQDRYEISFHCLYAPYKDMVSPWLRRLRTLPLYIHDPAVLKAGPAQYYGSRLLPPP